MIHRTIGRSWRGKRDVDSLTIVPDPEDYSQTRRQNVRDYTACVVGELRSLAGNAALPPETDVSINLQRSFYDTANVVQQGVISLHADREGFVQLDSSPMISSESTFSELIAELHGGRACTGIKFQPKPGRGLSELLDGSFEVVRNSGSSLVIRSRISM